MADLQPLVDAFHSHGGILSPSVATVPSAQSVSDPSLQQAFRRLASLLTYLPSQLQQQADQAPKEVEEAAEPKHELVTHCKISSPPHPECWSSSQLDFILNIAEAAILHYRRVPLENDTTKPVEGIYCSTITSCIKALKNISFSFQKKKILTLSDEQIYSRLIHLLELVVDEGKALECKPSLKCWEDLFDGLDRTTLLQDFDICRPIDVSFNELSLSNSPEYLIDGQQELEISEDIMVVLSHEKPFRLGIPGLKNCPSEFSNMQSASQHYAVIGASIYRELLNACGCFLASFDWGLCEDRERQLCIRLSLISQIIRLLCSLSKVASGFPHPEELLNGLADLAGFTPRLLVENISLNLEETNNQRCCYATFLTSVIALAEALGFGSCVTHNLRLYVAASALDVLVAARSRGFSHQKLPAVLEPQVISYIFGLIRTVHDHNWHNNTVTQSQKFWHSNILTWDSKLSLRTQRFNLTAERTQSEAMNILFPNDGVWLHDLLDALGQLYSIGIEASPATEKAQKEEQIGSSVEAAAPSCEDEALFGNLFSESSKQLSSNDSSVQSKPENRSCMLHDSVLQAVVDVLSFLRDCVFCRGCQLSIFHTAQGHMNGKGIDLLLEMFFHSSNEKIDAQGSMDMMLQLSKASFGLMNSILENGHISFELEENFLSSIIEKGYMGCTMPNKTSALLAKVLIHHSSVQDFDKHHSSMTLAIWKSFCSRVASSIHNSEWAHESIIDLAANLPSIFFLEVLLLAFHSSDVPSRLSILKSVQLLSKEFCKETPNLEGPPLSYCSLLFARVIMILRYLSLHLKAFPKWLVTDLKVRVSNCTEEEIPHSTALGSMFATPAVTAGQSLGDVGSIGQQTALSDDFLALLYDINGFSRGDGQLIELFKSSEEASEVCKDIRSFLDKWRGKSVHQVEELLVERYTFFIGWTTICMFAKHAKNGMPPGDLGGAGLHLWLTHSLSSYFNNNDSQGDTSDWWVYFKANLSRFEAACVRTEPVEMVVDRLRQNAGIHVLLSILQRGIELFLADASPALDRDEVLVFCEQLVCNCVTSGSLEELSRTLVSLLSASVDYFHYDLLDILNEGQISEALCSSLLLVLKGGIGWTKQDQLLTKLGVSFSPLHTLLRRGMPTSWHSGMLSKVKVFGNSGSFEKLFLSSFLHGYPCSYHLGSAMVFSRMCLVECMLEMLRLVLKVSEVLGQEANLPGFLDVLMAIKLGEIFECVHSKCDEVLWVLVPSKEEQARLYDLHVVKQKEFMLKSLSGNKSISEAVREELVLHVVDVFNNIFLDPTRNDVFRQYFTFGGGHLSLLVDLLDGCHQETVNMKVLQFLINVVGNEAMPLGGLKSELQEKLLRTETNTLCSWLEQRFFGFTNQLSEGGLVLSVSSNSVRDTLIGFLSGLLSLESTPAAEDLCGHVLNALLLSLERVFNSLDNAGRRSYFALLLQMAKKEHHKRLVIKSVLQLVGKLPGQNGNMEGLKSLMIFLCSLLNVCGGQRAQPLPKISEGKPWPNAHSLNLAPKGKQTVPKRSLEVIHVAMDRSGHSVDCDAVSVDEDEDDGTSDGEIISLEKEEDDDGSNCEKALASRVCTFTSSGNNFTEQHWYFCYTCDLTVSKGCCSVCAKVCHRGHKVVYSRLSRFFCDCGAGGVRGQSCLCLKPRKYVSSSSVVPSADQEAPPSESDSDLDDEVWIDNERLCKISVDEGEEKQLLTLFAELDVEGQVLSLCERLLNSFNCVKCYMHPMKDEIGFFDDKRLSFKGDFMQLRRFYKSGSYDMKIKAEYVNAKELKSHLVSGALFKSVLATNAKGKLAVGEGDKVTIFDVEQVIGSPSSAVVTVDKTTVKPLSKNSVRFELVHLVFNSINESYLAVAGYEDCQIFTINSRGEVTDRLAVELSLQDGYVCRVVWVPGSQVQLMVVTSKFVKIYDLSQDNISPVHYFTILEDQIVDAALIPMGQGEFLLIVLSYFGTLYRYFIAAGADPGAQVLTDTILIPEKNHPNKGASLHYSAASRLFFLSYSEGLSLIGRMDMEGRSFSELSSLTESDQDGKAKAAGLHHWKELAEGGQGLLVALSSQRNNSVVAVSIGSAEIQAQYLRATGNLGYPRVDGIAVHKSLLKDKYNLLILHDDGSLQVFTLSHGIDCSSGGDSSRSLVLKAEKVKKLGDAILGNRGSNSPAPVFPLDFFEKTSCITHEIRLGSDVLRNFDSEQAKLSLASDDGFLEGPSPSGFKITVHNSNAEMVMVGCRVHVGNSSTSHIPSELRIFQRTIKLEEGVRCWYDVPFTNAEALLADEEFTLTIGPTFGGFSLPRIDNLEVYGRPKDDFGWKENLEAVLDMDMQASASGSTGSSSKSKLSKTAPIEEQVVADCLTLLCGYYVVTMTKSTPELDGVSLESSRNRCRPLLELVFEGDRQPLLQAAARRLLHALYPAKDAFYQAKDALRLTGVCRVCPLLVAKIGLGGSALPLLIQEFTSQMRAVCKVALQRRPNFASFLESNGPSLIEDLMKVLLLVVDQQDAETVNNLVVPTVDLIYGYAECLALRLSNGFGDSECVAPAVALLRSVLFSSQETVRSSCSLAMSSRLLQVPFPRQTILVNDEVGDHSRSMPLTIESGPVTTGSDGQVMMEEDGGNASVQYCCDGCSIVPIVGRRWHCNVCPDFDLCEACYEVMDGDRLPPPHPRDHPMSAIPIDIDNNVGGDVSDIRFASIEDLSDENLLQVATALSLQSTSAPQSSLPDVPVSRDETVSTAIESKCMTFSASKRIFNSLLLKSLIDESKGWAKETCGSQALPLMQFYYRLASANTSPFIEGPGTQSINLEMFVRLLMEEVNLSEPLSIKTRSNFGEVVVLVFTFFNLMLRNWHQPGSDQQAISKSGTRGGENFQGVPSSSGTGSPASEEGPARGELGCQLDRACAALRQQHLMNYLLSIIQQLGQIFKSSSRSAESPVSSTSAVCGALLTVRKEFAAGNFAPFFTDSYARAHRNDLFGEFHRLLLESTFRLAYNLVRPEKTSDRDQASYKLDLKLDGWQEVLCSFINNPHTTSIRRFARRLLLHLCGSKGHYYNVRDAWQLSREVRKLFELVQKASGFRGLLVYERSVKLVKCLSAIAEVAAARPRNWQKYCLKHPDILPFLLNGVFVFGEESVVQTLKLLNLAFYAGKESGLSSANKVKSVEGAHTTGGEVGVKQSNQGADARKKKRCSNDDAVDGVTEKAFMDMELAADQLAAEGGNVLLQFIDAFLLEWNAACVRAEAKAVLIGTWHHGRVSVRELLLKKLLQKVPVLPSYGQNIGEYTELLTWVLGKGIQGSGSSSQESNVIQSCLNSETVKVFFDTLCSQNELLANHPNSRIYNTLSSLVDFDGYYLESEPCLACSCPEVPYSRMKLDSLKSETKFTDNRILVKCTVSHTIQSVTMNVHDARRSKSVKLLNLYYNNQPVTDLSELKNNWSLWKRAKSCHLAFNQTELKIEFSIPITACNFMIELDSFYENLQASSLESLQCPRCSRYVTDKHGICGNCHENAYQCRQCRNINYENLDSFLCNECGYSKYGRFEFNFMAKPSFNFESMENDEDMKKGLTAIESESENAHKRYQQLLGFKKPLLKLVSSIGETETDSQQKDSVQQMIVSLPGSSSFKINRKIAILGVLYGEKCKTAFDSLSRSVQTLQGLRRVLTSYLEQKRGPAASKVSPSRPSNRCYGCANIFVGHCFEWLQVLAKIRQCRQQLVSAGILPELFENNIHQGSKTARAQARSVLCAFTEGDAAAVGELNNLIKQKALYCLDHHRSMDVATCVREELQLLSETCALVDEFWESRLRVVFQLLFTSIQVGARHPVIAEHIILPCLRIISQACTPPKADSSTPDPENPASGTRTEARSSETDSAISTLQRTSCPPAPAILLDKDSVQETRGQDVPLVSYAEWKNGAAYVDFVRRQYIASQTTRQATTKARRDPKRVEYLALKYLLRWKRRACKLSLRNELSVFEESSWVCELALSACSPAIRAEMCGLIEVLCSQSSSRRSKFLNLLMALLPATRIAGESACDYFELLYKLVEPEDSRLFLTVRRFLQTLCNLIAEEVTRIEAQEHTFHVDISQGYILHKFIELLGKFLQVSNIRFRFMRDGLLSQVLEALLVVRGLVVQKTKLIGDCSRLLRDLLDGLLEESFENKRHFIRACIAGLQTHARNKRDRTVVYILELLCNIICPMKPEPAYMMVLNKAHTQEEFIRGSMTKNPYSSLEVGPLMRDVKNKICHQLDLLGLLEDDYGMELLVAGNIISLDLSVAQVYEQVWKKAQNQPSGSAGGTASGSTSSRECPPMTITYRLQGLDGEATEPMIKELEDDREETQDPEVEFSITGVMRESNGLEVVLNMVQALTDEDLKSSQEELALVLKLLMYCCKIRENRLALLGLGVLGVLTDTAKRAFALEATESAEQLLLIVECLVTEANESDIGIAKSSWSASKHPDTASNQAAHVVHMFLERLSHSGSAKRSSKQQRNNDMVARILPYLTYGEEAAMELLVKHFDPYLHDWSGFDQLLRRYHENSSDEKLSQQAMEHQLALENFCKVTESIKHDSQGERLKGLIIQKGITADCISYLKRAFAVFESGGDYKGSTEWAQSLELPSIPIILLILKGLASGHLVTQKCLKEEGVLPLLHALEGVPGDNAIGARAENLMDTLADKDGKCGRYLSEEVTKLRHTTRDEMRKRALQKREELLQGLGMRREVTSGGERIVISSSIEGLDDVKEEEAGLVCMVCREGYSLCPADMLGTYCYSKRVNLGIGTSSSTRAEWVYTTVSHFNVIHFQCHLEAKRADASLKNPKKEWEGAALRNNETLCNNLFPLRGPSVPLAQYARCVDQYWDNLNSLGRADGSRLRLLTYDIVLMLARFATGASFSTDSKGGGKESNSRVLPFMLQMACHLIDQGGVSQRRLQSKALTAYLGAPSPQESSSPSGLKSSTGSSPQRQGSTDETVQFMMVQSLLLMSLDEWQQHRRLFLQRGVYHAYMQFKHGRIGSQISSSVALPRPRSSTEIGISASTDSRSTEEDSHSGVVDKEQLFTVVQPMLIYTGLVDQFQRYLKSGGVRSKSVEPVPEENTKGEGGSAHRAPEPWEVLMKERLRDIKAMLGFSKDLLEWLAEMQSTDDLQEAFDVMGALGDALSCHSSCEDFIIEAIGPDTIGLA